MEDRHRRLRPLGPRPQITEAERGRRESQGRDAEQIGRRARPEAEGDSRSKRRASRKAGRVKGDHERAAVLRGPGRQDVFRHGHAEPETDPKDQPLDGFGQGARRHGQHGKRSRRGDARRQRELARADVVQEPNGERRADDDSGRLPSSAQPKRNAGLVPQSIVRAAAWIAKLPEKPKASAAQHKLASVRAQIAVGAGAA